MPSFGPGGRLVVTAGSDGTARIWNAGTGKAHGHARSRRRAGHRAAQIFGPGGSTVATAGDDGLAVVWRIASREATRPAPTRRAVTSVRFGPNGIDRDRERRRHGACLASVHSRAAVVLRGHKREVTDAEFGPDGRLVVTASLDGTARCGTPGPARRSRSRSPTATPSHCGLQPRRRSHRHGERRPDRADLGHARGRGSPCSAATAATSGARRSARTGSGSSRRASTALRASGTQRPGSRSSRLGTARLPGRERRPQPDRLPDRRDVARRRSARPGRRPRSNALDSSSSAGARVVSAAFSADGRAVVTADAQAGVRFWDPATGRLEGSRKLRRRPGRRGPEPRRRARRLAQRERCGPSRRRRRSPSGAGHARSRLRPGTSTAAVPARASTRAGVGSSCGPRTTASSSGTSPHAGGWQRFRVPAQLRFGGSEPGRHARGYRRQTTARPAIWSVPGGRELRPPRPVKHALAVVSASFERRRQPATHRRKRPDGEDLGRAHRPRARLAPRPPDPSWRVPCSTPTSSGWRPPGRTTGRRASGTR